MHIPTERSARAVELGDTEQNDGHADVVVMPPRPWRALYDSHLGGERVSRSA